MDKGNITHGAGKGNSGAGCIDGLPRSLRISGDLRRAAEQYAQTSPTTELTTCRQAHGRSFRDFQVITCYGQFYHLLCPWSWTRESALQLKES